MTAQVELLNFEDYNKRQSNKQVKQINSCKLKSANNGNIETLKKVVLFNAQSLSHGLFRDVAKHSGRVT